VQHVKPGGRGRIRDEVYIWIREIRGKAMQTRQVVKAATTRNRNDNYVIPVTAELNNMKINFTVWMDQGGNVTNDNLIGAKIALEARKDIENVIIKNWPNVRVAVHEFYSPLDSKYPSDRISFDKKIFRYLKIGIEWDEERELPSDDFINTCKEINVDLQNNEYGLSEIQCYYRTPDTNVSIDLFTDQDLKKDLDQLKKKIVTTHWK
jgi:hypothetical protein